MRTSSPKPSRLLLTLGLVAAVGLSAAACNKGGGSKDGGDKKSTGSTAASTEKKDDRILARIGDETITVTDFENHINRQSPFVRRRFNNPEQKKKLLEDLVRREVMAQEAATKGYDKHPEVVETMKKVMVQKLIREEFDKNFRRVDIPEEELKKYYQDHDSDYHQPEMVRLSRIFIKADPDNKAAARKEAIDILADLKDKTTDYNAFRVAAQKFSDDPDVKNTGGDMNYLSEKELKLSMGEKIAAAGFGLKTVGDLSEVVETDKGYTVLKLTGRRRAIDRSFDQVKNQIKNRMARERRTQSYDAYIDGLMNKARVTKNDTMLQEVQVDTTGAETGGAPAAPAAPESAPK